MGIKSPGDFIEGGNLKRDTFPKTSHPKVVMQEFIFLAYMIFDIISRIAETKA